MLSGHNPSYTRSLLLVVGVVALFGLAIAPASPTVDQTSPPQNTSEEHTLVIETTGEPIQYTLSASGSVSGDSGENDAVQGKTLSGRVGGVPWNNTSNDTKDTITYTGYIETFQHRGDNVQLQLDEQEISPTTLSANHLQIAHPNADNGPINYEISVSGNATLGESTDDQAQITPPDGSNDTQIQGQLTDQYDSFYFTGNISNTSFDQQAFVFLNGQNVTDSNGATGTPAETATSSTPTNNSSTPTNNSSTDTPVTMTIEHTTTTQSAAGGETASSQSSTSPLGFLFRLGSGVVLLALIVAGVWYFVPKQQRW